MAIQFPARYGVEAPQPAAAGGNSTYGHTPDPRGSSAPASTPQAVVDSLVLQGAAVAGLELDLLTHWDDGAAQARGAAEFQLARAAAQAGNNAASLEHLELAILADPVHAAAVAEDPAFSAMRGAVRELVGHATVLARMRAEASIDAGLSAMESAGSGSAARPDQVRAFLDLAQAHFELGTYVAYVEAAQAAMRAQQIAEHSRIELRGKFSTARSRRPLTVRELGPVRRAVRRLWDKLPLLAILLGWLFAGIVGGVASLPFQDGYMSETRQTLFSIWALGLLAMVLLGFVRSIVRLRRDR